MSQKDSRNTGGRIAFREHDPVDIASCNVCCACNYHSPAGNEQVKRLFDLEIGRGTITQVTLCARCLGKMFFCLDAFTKAQGEYEVSMEVDP